MGDQPKQRRRRISKNKRADEELARGAMVGIRDDHHDEQSHGHGTVSDAVMAELQSQFPGTFAAAAGDEISTMPHQQEEDDQRIEQMSDGESDEEKAAENESEKRQKICNIPSLALSDDDDLEDADVLGSDDEVPNERYEQDDVEDELELAILAEIDAGRHRRMEEDIDDTDAPDMLRGGNENSADARNPGDRDSANGSDGENNNNAMTALDEDVVGHIGVDGTEASAEGEGGDGNEGDESSEQNVWNNWKQDSESPLNGTYGNPLYDKTLSQSYAQSPCYIANKVAKFFRAGGMNLEDLTPEEEKNQGTMSEKILPETMEGLSYEDHYEAPPTQRSRDDNNAATPDGDESDGVSLDEEILFLPKGTKKKVDAALGDGRGLVSSNMLSGPHPLSHAHYFSIRALVYVFAERVIDRVKAIVKRGYEANARSGSGTLHEKLEEIKDAVYAAIPFSPLTTAKRQKKKISAPFRNPTLKLHLEDKDESKQKTTNTRVCLPSNQLATDLATPGVGEAIMNGDHATAEYAPTHFHATDIAKDPAACHRPAPRGALADSCGGQAASDFDTEQLPYTSRLFCQGSLLKASFRKCKVTRRFPVQYGNGATNPRYRISVPLTHMNVVPEGEPVIMTKDMDASAFGRSSDCHNPEAILQHCQYGDVIWPLSVYGDSSQQDTDELRLSDIPNLQRQAKAEGKAECAFQGVNAYLCYSFATEEIDDSDGEFAGSDSDCDVPAGPNVSKKSIILVSKDQTDDMQRRHDRHIPLTNIEIRDRPESWYPGDLRPRESPARVNPFTSSGKMKYHGRTASGEQVVKEMPILNVAIRLYMDDFHVSADGKKSAGGIYYDMPGLDQRRRTGVESVRISGVATDKTESDSVLLSLVDDLSTLENQGRPMKTVLGLRWVFVKVYGLAVDYVQAGKSALSFGHSANAPCGGCSFRRGSAEGPRYYHIEGIASLNHFFSIERCDALRHRDLDNEDYSHIGVKASAHVYAKDTYDKFVAGREGESESENDLPTRTKKAPAHALRLLSECSPAKGRFDPFLDTLPGPDHCLFLGIGKSLLNALFSVLDKDTRRTFARRMKLACREAGIEEPGSVLKSAHAPGNGFVAGLSVGQIAAVLLITPLVIDSFRSTMLSDETPDTMKTQLKDATLIGGLLCDFNNIIAVAYFNANSARVTYEEAHRRDDSVSHIGDQCLLFMDKVARCMNREDRNCSRAVSAALKNFCDKPNVHRMLEILTFWLPNCGNNMAHLSELHFEKTHQLLKCYLKHVPDVECSGSHAIQRCVNDDAMKRVGITLEDDSSECTLFGNWVIGDYGKRCVQISRQFLTPGASPHDTALNSLIRDRPRRFWMTKPGGGTLNRAAYQDDIEAVRSEIRVPPTAGLRKITAAKFGIIRQKHNIIRPGCMIRGLCMEEMDKMFPPGYSGPKIIKTGTDLAQEYDPKQGFIPHSFTLLVSEMWEVTKIVKLPSGEEITKISIYAKGRRYGQYFISNSGRLLTNRRGVPVYGRIGRFALWVKLNVTCHRVASFMWSPADGIEVGETLIGMPLSDRLRSKHFLVLDTTYGFPSKKG